MNDHQSDLSEEFDRELSMLSESHPAIRAAEFDRAKARADVRARRPRSSGWGFFVRSRAAVVAAITAGALMSSGATALGVSGLASSGDASSAQYGQNPPGSGTAPSNDNGTLPSSSNGAPGNTQAVAPEQQAAQAGPSTAGTLPFTGFALIPILLVGLALLAAGLAARRTASRMGAPPS